MSTMNTFYARLVNAPEVYDPYYQGLTQLTQAERTQMSHLDLEWDVWAVDPA